MPLPPGVSPIGTSQDPAAIQTTLTSTAAPTAGDAYDAAKRQAQQRINTLEGQRTDLLDALAKASYTQKDQITQQIRSLETALAGAYRDAAVTARAAAAAASKAATGPNGINPVAYMKADADARRADALETRAAAYAEGTAAKRQQLEADSRLKDADANVAQAKADMAAATAPDEIARAHVALQQATATFQATQEANKRAGYETQIAGAQAAVAPQVAQAGAARATAEASTAAAQAAVAPQAAQAAVSKAQADVDKTNQEIADLQRQARQAPTDSDAAQAIQTALAQKQTDLATAQQQLTAAQQLLPINVAQGQANVATTQAGVQKGLLGTMYGLQDRVKVIADMIRSGQITDPAQGYAQLQDYINTTEQGTTPFERNRALLDTETQRRQQDYSLAASQGSAYTSGLSSAMSTFGKLNDTTPVGSDAAGRGFLATMGMLGNQLQTFKPPPGVMDSPLMASMRGPAMPAPAAPAPGPGDAGHTITINIGGGGAPGQAPAPPLGAAAPAVPPMLSAGAPVMPNHVDDLWANDPNLNPGAQAATGAIDRTSQGLGGM